MENYLRWSIVFSKTKPLAELRYLSLLRSSLEKDILPLTGVQFTVK